MLILKSVKVLECVLKRVEKEFSVFITLKMTNVYMVYILTVSLEDIKLTHDCMRM